MLLKYSHHILCIGGRRSAEFSVNLAWLLTAFCGHNDPGVLLNGYHLKMSVTDGKSSSFSALAKSSALGRLKGSSWKTSHGLKLRDSIVNEEIK